MDLIGFLQRLLLFLMSAQFHFQTQSNSILVIFALKPLLKQPESISKTDLPSRLQQSSVPFGRSESKSCTIALILQSVFLELACLSVSGVLYKVLTLLK